jgi:hypothetical protein
MLKDKEAFLRAITLSFIISIQVCVILYIFVPKPNKYDVKPRKVQTLVNSSGLTTTYYDYEKLNLKENRGDWLCE